MLYSKLWKKYYIFLKCDQSNGHFYIGTEYLGFDLIRLFSLTDLNSRQAIFFLLIWIQNFQF